MAISTARFILASDNAFDQLSTGQSDVLVQLVTPSDQVEVAVGASAPSNNTGHLLLEYGQSAAFSSLGGTDYVYARSIRTGQAATVAVTK